MWCSIDKHLCEGCQREMVKLIGKYGPKAYLAPEHQKQSNYVSVGIRTKKIKLQIIHKDLKKLSKLRRTGFPKPLDTTFPTT